MLSFAALTGPAPAQDFGAYLAARTAGMQDDFREAAHWFGQALAADPENLYLMEGAVVAQIGIGRIETAIELARRLDDAGGKSQAAWMALIGDQAQRGEFEPMLADLAAGRSVGRLMDVLLTGWAELGAGRVTEALAAFDELVATPGLEVFGLYHKALALASIGNYEAAERIFSGSDSGPVRVVRRGALAHIQILSQLERNDEAATVLRDSFAAESDPSSAELLARIESGETIPYDVARNATEGMAEVFFTLGVALNGEASDAYTLLYSRIAAWLRPDHGDAVLMTAGMLENQSQFDLATEVYAGIGTEDAAHIPAEIGRARALGGAGDTDGAIGVLRDLAARYPDVFTIHLSLGDTLRRAERWPEATEAYTAALDLVEEPVPEPYWAVFYSRAITLERQDLWPRAEADFRRALALNPGQPQVLNYLGYSFLDRRENIDEAMRMIEEAVAASPDSGYIVDSLAWGLFVLGRYEEAVEPMERASLLEPVDPVVTDHLGDVYWAVGRQMEARFQWRRALSFDPEEKDATRIRRKLEIGLDAVLQEEGADPLRPVNADAGN
ncbi:tetratricopeptide repeat protein [Tabrizicola sp. DMG-N-6]|uniref:Tetratricopeptide repeat protein n=2 Tax=Szabonella alba TaxID=2804194 RepID=A0A8K0XYS0_9RHOB|nr:tetratricopeptide repeat protein [Szabonella alba]